MNKANRYAATKQGQDLFYKTDLDDLGRLIYRLVVPGLGGFDIGHECACTQPGEGL